MDIYFYNGLDGDYGHLVVPYQRGVSPFISPRGEIWAITLRISVVYPYPIIPSGPTKETSHTNATADETKEEEAAHPTGKEPH